MLEMKLTIGRALMIFATAAAVACGSAPDNDAGKGSGGSSSSGGSAGSSSAGSGGSASEATLNEAQLFKVLDAIHRGKIAEAEVAVARSSNADVVAFASEVAAAHEQAQTELSALAKQRSITPADSKTSLTRTAISNVELSNLTAASAAGFDTTYLQGQLADHERVITLVASLLTMTSDAAVKAQLNALQALTKAHQGVAKDLLASL